MKCPKCGSEMGKNVVPSDASILDSGAGGCQECKDEDAEGLGKNIRPFED